MYQNNRPGARFLHCVAFQKHTGLRGKLCDPLDGLLFSQRSFDWRAGCVRKDTACFG